MKFRKKPVVVEARQFTGTNANDLLAWGDECGIDMQASGLVFGPDGDVTRIYNLIVGTPEGDHRADVGDWIVKGIKGEFYPVKPDIFAATYEPAPVSSPAPSPSQTEAPVERCLACMRARSDHGHQPHEFMSNLLPAGLPKGWDVIEAEVRDLIEALEGQIAHQGIAPPTVSAPSPKEERPAGEAPTNAAKENSR